MGSLTNNAGAVAAFTGQPFPNGLDLGRCVIQQDLGIFVADPSATFRAGSIVTKNSVGIAVADGTSTSLTPIGIAKWNKATTLKGVVVDEKITLVGTTPSNLKYGNVSNVKVSATKGGAALGAVTTDFTVVAGNGTVAGTVADTATGVVTAGDVYVSYTFDLTESMLDFQGRNFWNFNDDVTIQDGHITVITDWTLLFTTQYDTSYGFQVGDKLYCTASGLFAAGGTSASTFANGGVVGKVFQAPTATDPYLGVMAV